MEIDAVNIFRASQDALPIIRDATKKSQRCPESVHDERANERAPAAVGRIEDLMTEQALGF
jgi:predicted CoA-binding protein